MKRTDWPLEFESLLQKFWEDFNGPPAEMRLVKTRRAAVMTPI